MAGLSRIESVFSTSTKSSASVPQDGIFCETLSLVLLPVGTFNGSVLCYAGWSCRGSHPHQLGRFIQLFLSRGGTGAVSTLSAGLLRHDGRRAGGQHAAGPCVYTALNSVIKVLLVEVFRSFTYYLLSYIPPYTFT